MRWTTRHHHAALAGTTLLALSVLLSASPAAAAPSPTPTPTPITVSAVPGQHSKIPPGFSVTVSPTRMELTAANTKGPHTFQVENRGRSAVDMTVGITNFTASRSGALAFSRVAPYAASSWVHLSPAHFRLPSMTAMPVTMTMSVPRGADFGDHQMSLAFLVPAGKGAGNIKINRGIAAPVIVTVPGPTSNDSKVSWLHLPRFVLRGPVTVDATLQDTGTVHRDFRGPGRLQLQGPGSGGQFPDVTVLRGATRDISTTWNPPLACLCGVTLSIPGKNGLVSIASATTIVLPVDLMAGGVALLAALVLLVRYRRRHFNSRVLAAAAALAPASSGGA